MKTKVEWDECHAGQIEDHFEDPDEQDSVGRAPSRKRRNHREGLGTKSLEMKIEDRCADLDNQD